MAHDHDPEQPEDEAAAQPAGEIDDAELDETSGAGLWPPPPIYPS